MELRQQIETSLKQAMKDKDETRLTIVRLLLTAVKNREKELRRAPNEEEIRQLIATQIKKGREAAEQYRQGGRQELADREEQEITILQQFLPEQLTPEAVERLVEETIAELGASSMKDMGTVMKRVMAEVAGRFDGKYINDLVRRKLQ